VRRETALIFLICLTYITRLKEGSDLKMESIGKEKQKFENKTEVVYNNQEAGFKEDFNIKYEKEPKYIFFVENCRKKERKNLDKDIVDGVKEEIKFWKNKYSSSKILHIFQFKKGLLKTKEQIEITKKCQDVENADGICFYEEFKDQEKLNFKNQLLDFLKFKPEIEKYIVLEIESEDIAEKIVFALSKGLKKFIFVGGEYNNNDLWITLTSAIKESQGETIMLLPARLHKTTKESYIKKALLFKVNYVVHGMPYGGPIKNKERIIRFLDKKDLIYKEIDEIQDKELREIIREKCSNKQEQYELSRVLAIDVANTFSKTYRTNEIIKA